MSNLSNEARICSLIRHVPKLNQIHQTYNLPALADMLKDVPIFTWQSAESNSPDEDEGDTDEFDEVIIDVSFL